LTLVVRLVALVVRVAVNGVNVVIGTIFEKTSFFWEEV
jgi:hypothetical protein